MECRTSDAYIIVSGTLEQMPRGAWPCSGPPSVVARFLLVPHHHPSPLLQAPDQALDRVATLVLPLIAGRRPSPSFPRTGRDGRLDASLSTPLPDPVGIVGPVSGHRLGAFAWATLRPMHRDRVRDRVHQVGDDDGLVALLGRQNGGQWQVLPVTCEVDLCRESAPAVAEGWAYSRVLSAGSVPFLSAFELLERRCCPHGTAPHRCVLRRRAPPATGERWLRASHLPPIGGSGHRRSSSCHSADRNRSKAGRATGRRSAKSRRCR